MDNPTDSNTDTTTRIPQDGLPQHLLDQVEIGLRMLKSNSTTDKPGILDRLRETSVVLDNGETVNGLDPRAVPYWNKQLAGQAHIQRAYDTLEQVQKLRDEQDALLANLRQQAALRGIDLTLAKYDGLTAEEIKKTSFSKVKRFLLNNPQFLPELYTVLKPQEIELQNAVQDTRNAVSATLDENMQLTSINAKMQQQLVTMFDNMTQNQSLMQDIQDKIAEYDALGGYWQSIDDQNHTLTAENLDLREQVEDLNTSLMIARARCKTANESIDNADERLLSMHIKCDRLATTLGVEPGIDCINEMLDAAKNIPSLMQQIDDATDKSKVQQEHLDAAINASKSWESLLEKKAQELEVANQTVISTQDENLELKQNVEQLTATCKSHMMSEHTVEYLRRLNQSKQELIDVQSVEIRQLKNTAESQKSQLLEYEQEMARLREQLRQSAMTIRESESNNNLLTEDVNTLSAQTAELNATKSSLQVQNSKMERELQDIRTARSDGSADLEVAQRHIEDLQDKVQYLDISTILDTDCMTNTVAELCDVKSAATYHAAENVELEQRNTSLFLSLTNAQNQVKSLETFAYQHRTCKTDISALQDQLDSAKLDAKRLQTEKTAMQLAIQNSTDDAAIQRISLDTLAEDKRGLLLLKDQYEHLLLGFFNGIMPNGEQMPETITKVMISAAQMITKKGEIRFTPVAPNHEHIEGLVTRDTPARDTVTLCLTILSGLCQAKPQLSGRILQDLCENLETCNANSLLLGLCTICVAVRTVTKRVSEAIFVPTISSSLVILRCLDILTSFTRFNNLDRFIQNAMVLDLVPEAKSTKLVQLFKKLIEHKLSGTQTSLAALITLDLHTIEIQGMRVLADHSHIILVNQSGLIGFVRPDHIHISFDHESNFVFDFQNVGMMPTNTWVVGLPKVAAWLPAFMQAASNVPSGLETLTMLEHSELGPDLVVNL